MEKLRFLKPIVQKPLGLLGLEIRKKIPSEMEQLRNFLAINRIDTVLDIGANVGQFGSLLRASGYQKKILSFEPVTSAYEKLVETAKSDSLWTVAPRCAVGGKTGINRINISMNTQSSSILPIMKAHTDSESRSSYVGTESVNVITLDQCKLFDRNERIYIKIDTQGFEQQVIDGASKLLKSAIGLQVELSLTALYQGQGNFISIIKQLADLDFEIWAFNQSFLDFSSGRQLQVDLTCFRKEAVAA